MYEVLIVIYLIVALAIVGLVLIQQGKGADMGAAFGSGASGTLFGSSGSGSFLTRSTAVLATLFFVLSLLIGNLTAKEAKRTSEFEQLSVPSAETVPADAEVPVETNKTDVPE